MEELKKSPEELISEIGQLVKDGYAHKDDPDQLSKIAYDLAAKNWALGAYQAEFEDAERAMKAELGLDTARNLEKLTADGSALNKAEVRTTIELAPKRINYNKTVSSVEKIKICRKDTERVIDAIRTRVSLIKREIDK